MSKDRDGYMKTSQDVDMRLIKPNIKVDAIKILLTLLNQWMNL